MMSRSDDLKITIPTMNEDAEEEEEEEGDGLNDVVMAMDEEDVAASKQKQKKKKKADVDIKEDDIEWTELMKSEGVTSKPSKPKDFERLLVGSPDSSIIWIQYIAFYLTKKNVARARNLIQRALRQIKVSMDKE